MNLAKKTTVVVALLLGLAAPVEARTWRVMRDGSGDYTTIQPATDHAASGDTVLIGPGRYTEKQSVTLPGWSWAIDIYVYVRTSGLTIMGMSRDEVIIGPETATFHDFGPQAISFINVARGDVKNLTTVNAYNGVYTQADSHVDGCAFRGCYSGVTGFCQGALSVSNCDFSNCNEGIIAFDPTTRLDVANSVFQDNVFGVDAVATPDVKVQNCVVRGVAVGIQFEQGSVGEIVGCHVSGVSSVGISVTGGSRANIQDTKTTGGFWSVRCVDGSLALASGSTFHGGSYATIRTDTAPFSFHDCHILSTGGALIDASDWRLLPDTHLDMRNNYWGIADRDSIAALIRDGYDDPQVHVFVDFEPFSATPLPTEKKTLGGVKGLYR